MQLPSAHAQAPGLSTMTGSPWPQDLQSPAGKATPPRPGTASQPAETSDTAAREAAAPPTPHRAAARSASALPQIAPLPPVRPEELATAASAEQAGGQPEASASAPVAAAPENNGMAAIAPLPPVRPQFPLEVAAPQQPPAQAAAPVSPPAASTTPSWWPFNRQKTAPGVAEQETPLQESPAGKRVARYAVSDADVESCVARLRKAGAIVERIAPISRGSCGVRNGVRLTALPGGLPLSKPGTLTCAMAEATAEWVAAVAQPAARQRLQANITRVIIGPTYACRTMNHRRGAKLSEHAYANAIDIAGFAFDSRKDYMVRPSHPAAAENLFQSYIRKNACKTFDTVIGPGGDRHHDDHLHLDLRNRGPGRQVCR